MQQEAREVFQRQYWQQQCYKQGTSLTDTFMSTYVYMPCIYVGCWGGEERESRCCGRESEKLVVGDQGTNIYTAACISAPSCYPFMPLCLLCMTHISLSRSCLSVIVRDPELDGLSKFKALRNYYRSCVYKFTEILKWVLILNLRTR